MKISSLKAPFLSLILLLSLQGLKAQKSPLTIYQEKTEQGYIFYVDNSDIVPYSIKLDFKELENLTPDKDLNKYVALAPPQTIKKEILRLNKQKIEKGSSYDFAYMFSIGNPELKIDENFAYWFPYQHGHKERVGQGNNGSGTHTGLNAVDFNLEIGEAVHAARTGLVIEVKEDSDKGGNAPEFEKYGNYIRIYHADGTIASYVHLQQNGSLVKKGDQVNAGDQIGSSGNTGYSSGPHLHFMVTYNRNFQNLSLPVKFLMPNGEKIIPKEGSTYYAFHEGKPEFKVEDQQAFNELKYEQQLQKSTLEDNIKITTDSFGDYTLIYVNNGFKSMVTGKLIVKTDNMESTKTLPHQFEVPANTKMYLLALKPKDPSAEFGYQLSAEFK